MEGEAARILDEARAGIAIEPQNSRMLADAVLQYADSAELRAVHGANGRKVANEDYSLDRLARRYERLLLDLAL